MNLSNSLYCAFHTKQTEKKKMNGLLNKPSATKMANLSSIPNRVKPKVLKIGIHHSFPA